MVVKHGAYARWVLEQADAGAQLSKLQSDVKKHVSELDAKEFVGKCSYPGCVRPVAKLTAYYGNDSDLYCWCEQCDPYSLGANRGKLYQIASYSDALKHVSIRCGATNGGYDRIAKAYARTKGLAARVGASTAQKFFEGKKNGINSDPDLSGRRY